VRKKISLGAAITFMLITAAVTFSLTTVYTMQNFNNKISNIKEREAMYAKLSEIDTSVRKNYIGAIDEDKLMDSIASGYLRGIGDPYSQYLSAEDYSAYMRDYEGQLVGIGVEVTGDASGYLRISRVYEGSPAEAAALQKGDLIVSVGGAAITEKSVSDAAKAISGEVGTTVSLGIRRELEEFEVELTRRRMEVPTISYRMIGTLGYIRITDFTEATVDQFDDALDSLLRQDAQGIVFDLRDNTGGSVPALCNMLDMLVPEGELVSVEYSDGSRTLLARSDSSEVLLPMVTITNKNTASASELFVQVLKAYDKAPSVGETTYGKGVMQTLFQLSDGSAVNLTNGKTYAADSENFDGVGIAPDYEVKLSAEEQERFDELDENTDPQLAKALSVLTEQIAGN
jgi:carboxyl-terminal processing protease